jgi:hypothetical protein
VGGPFLTVTVCVCVCVCIFVSCAVLYGTSDLRLRGVGGQSRSLLSSAVGCTTLLMRFPYEVRTPSYVFGVLRNHYPPEVRLRLCLCLCLCLCSCASLR